MGRLTACASGDNNEANHDIVEKAASGYEL